MSLVYKDKGYELYQNRVKAPDGKEYPINLTKRIRNGNNSFTFYFRQGSIGYDINTKTFAKDLGEFIKGKQVKPNDVENNDEIKVDKSKDPLWFLILRENPELRKVYDSRTMSLENMKADFKNYIKNPPKADFIASKVFNYNVPRFKDYPAKTQNAELVIKYEYTYNQDNINDGILRKVVNVNYPIAPKQERININNNIIIRDAKWNIEDKSMSIPNDIIVNDVNLESKLINIDADNTKSRVETIINKINGNDSQNIKIVKELNKSALNDKEKRPAQDIFSSPVLQVSILAGIGLIIFGL